ncbi:MAG: SpoIIE family protein phosphatase [Blastocatellia bacterium]|nr:SpoIIE family protein phosphatase [Blastocatellia bacterium]
MTELLRSLLPITWMGKAMCAGLVIWFIDWALVEGETLFGSRALKSLVDFGAALAFVPLLYFGVRGADWLMRHLLWRLRRRLIVTYLLIGALPLLLITLLFGLIALAVVMQSNTNLVSRRLDGYLEQSRAATQALAGDLAGLDWKAVKPEDLRRKLQERANALAPVFPALHLDFQAADAAGIHVEAGGLPGPAGGAHALPPWLVGRGEFDGLAVEEQLPNAGPNAGPNSRRIVVHHVLRLPGAAAGTFHLSYPVGDALCAQLSRTTNLSVKPGMAAVPLVQTSAGPDIDDTGRSGELRPEGIPIFKSIVDWETGRPMESDVLALDGSFLHPRQIWRRIQQFKSNSVIGNLVVYLIGGVSVFFLFIALAAIGSAIFLTRSITGAVHNLYQGTRRVEGGDLDHEIAVPGGDQLAELSRSFNSMTRSIRELLRVSAEKQRLDQEMKIAAQVQARLFPRALPRTEALDFAPGVCIPARSVSGDYYDFFEITPGLIGVTVADVCGKGVSAALMMANLQANLRGQVQAYHDAYVLKAQTASGAAVEAAPRTHPVHLIVQRVNQQLAGSMIDASYITFFYAEYDERNATLRYTNAGHNPPLLLRRRDARIEKLECGGTVLGLFADAEYESDQLRLEPGDILLAYTDGVVESRNRRGEEFGEERLGSLLCQHAHLDAAHLEEQILRVLQQWTADAEQEDDLTLVLFKVNPADPPSA